ncbi:MAG: formin-like protein 18 [Desulfovibrio sp.]|jgi:hypothetical protein|nr:formin-like protein 18 [Desulfovibrio sp.]MBI4960024.1 formin-like protein 18 [Desulfovibrio sp.]
MGKLLQVRVSVSTIDPGKVEDVWPLLSHLAYPPGHGYAPAQRGVLELVDTLRARITAGEVPAAVAERIRPGVEAVEKVVQSLREALASWQPEKAQQITEKIEDSLDDLEGLAGYR